MKGTVCLGLLHHYAKNRPRNVAARALELGLTYLIIPTGSKKSVPPRSTQDVIYAFTHFASLAQHLAAALAADLDDCDRAKEKPSHDVFCSVRQREEMACEATEVWLNGQRRGAGDLLLPSPQVLATVLQSLREEELAWLEQLATCLGAAVALARERQSVRTEVRVQPRARYDTRSSLLLPTQALIGCVYGWFP
jgi:hypothetical protein